MHRPVGYCLRRKSSAPSRVPRYFFLCAEWIFTRNSFFFERSRSVKLKYAKWIYTRYLFSLYICTNWIFKTKSSGATRARSLCFIHLCANRLEIQNESETMSEAKNNRADLDSHLTPTISRPTPTPRAHKENQRNQLNKTKAEPRSVITRKTARSSTRT